MLDILSSILFAAHMLGLAAVVGVFFVQMRAKEGFRTGILLAGAITQVVTGVALAGLAEARESDLDYTWVSIKLGIGVIVLVAAIIALVQQRRGGTVRPAFHTAGGLAIVNVLVATLWP